MRTAKLKLAGVALIAAGLIGGAGFGAYTAAAQPVRPPREPGKAEPQPPRPQPPAEGWLTDTGSMPDAFPDITAPPGRVGVATLGPALFAKDLVKIEAADGTYSRLLKARLDQDRQFLGRVTIRIEMGSFVAQDLYEMLHTCEDIRAISAELWRNDVPTQDAVLVDLVRLAKAWESFATARVQAGTDPPHVLNLVVRDRLAAEAALWKHRNPGKAP
jgi:hypothetical protein